LTKKTRPFDTHLLPEAADRDDWWTESHEEEFDKVVAFRLPESLLKQIQVLVNREDLRYGTNVASFARHAVYELVLAHGMRDAGSPANQYARWTMASLGRVMELKRITQFRQHLSAFEGPLHEYIQVGDPDAVARELSYMQEFVESVQDPFWTKVCKNKAIQLRSVQSALAFLGMYPQYHALSQRISEWGDE